MISISLYRRELERLDACADGLALYDAIAALLPESDRLRHRRIRVARWTKLHSLWLYVAGYARLAAWLEREGLIPMADLSRADLSRAHRGSSTPIPGWRTDANGFLERAS